MWLDPLIAGLGSVLRLAFFPLVVAVTVARAWSEDWRNYQEEHFELAGRYGHLCDALGIGERVRQGQTLELPVYLAQDRYAMMALDFLHEFVKLALEEYNALYSRKSKYLIRNILDARRRRLKYAESCLRRAGLFPDTQSR